MADNTQNNSACARFCEITELAENVFLRLSQADLLCGAQQTCKTWKHTIDTSDLILELLFFKPIADIRVVVNGKATAWYECMEFCSSGLGKPIYPVENPFLCMLGHRITEDDLATASWRKMLPTQPPPLKVLVSEPRESFRANSVVKAGGRPVTMEDLVADSSADSSGYCMRGSWVWKAFKGHWQLQRLKTHLRLRTMEEENEDFDWVDEDNTEDLDWIMGWTR